MRLLRTSAEGHWQCCAHELYKHTSYAPSSNMKLHHARCLTGFSGEDRVHIMSTSSTRVSTRSPSNYGCPDQRGGVARAFVTHTTICDVRIATSRVRLPANALQCCSVLYMLNTTCAGSCHAAERASTGQRSLSAACHSKICCNTLARPHLFTGHRALRTQSSQDTELSGHRALRTQSSQALNAPTYPASCCLMPVASFLSVSSCPMKYSTMAVSHCSARSSYLRSNLNSTAAA